MRELEYWKLKIKFENWKIGISEIENYIRKSKI